MSMILGSWLCWVSFATTRWLFPSVIIILLYSYILLLCIPSDPRNICIYAARILRIFFTLCAPMDPSVFRRSMLLGRDGKAPTAESVRVPFNLHWFPWQLAGSRAHVWALKQRDSHLRISQSGKNVVPRVGLLHCSSCLTTMMCMLIVT